VDRRALKATLGAGVLVALSGVLGLSALSAGAQTPPTDPPPTTAPPTTEAPTTSTSVAPTTSTTEAPATTTTVDPVTTTTQQRSTTTQQRGTTSTTSRSSSSSTSTSSTSSTTTSAPAPITPSGYSGPSSGSGTWFTSGWKISSIVAGLVAAAGGLLFMTVLYWRQTRPVPSPVPSTGFVTRDDLGLDPS
jgi:hypothetical protein